MYLSAEMIAALQGTEKTHFLNPNAKRLNKSLGDAVGLKNIGVHLIEIEPGQSSTEFHAHRYEEECTYVLAGTGKVVLGDASHRIGPGDFIGYPLNGVAHEMLNDGEERLVCLVIGQRLAQDVTEYPRKNKRLYRMSGEWELVDTSDVERVQR